MHLQKRATRNKFRNEIPVRHPVYAVKRNAVKTEFLRFEFPVGIISRPRQGATPYRRNVYTLIAIGKPFVVAQKHKRVSHKLMPESYGLGALQVRVPRTNGVFILFRLIGNRVYERFYFAEYAFGFFFKVHT